jgi:hypothetical protein
MTGIARRIGSALVWWLETLGESPPLSHDLGIAAWAYLRQAPPPAPAREPGLLAGLQRPALRLRAL